MSRVAVHGAGGFIGGHLVNDLVAEGHSVLAVDRKKPSEWEQINPAAENLSLDLSIWHHALEATRGIEQVYLLAADMGGMGFIETHKLDCMMTVLTSTHVLKAAALNGVERLFYSSSACVYPAYLQHDTDVTALKESDAYPAESEDGYGWEKLFTERLCRHFYEDTGLETRIARYHNVYGTKTTYKGGREKAPAAICRKVAEAQIRGTNTIDIWGDGNQTRSFMYADDCVKGSKMLMNSDFRDPLNIGSAELVSINQLVSIVEDIAGIKLKREYKLDAPQGVRGRNSDNTLINQVFDWEPSITLRDGLEKTYAWVYDQVLKDE